MKQPEAGDNHYTIAVSAATTPAKSCTNRTHPTRLLSNMHDWQKLKLCQKHGKNDDLQQVN